MLADFSSSSYRVRKTDGRTGLREEKKKGGEEYSNAEATPLQTFQTVNSNAISWAFTVPRSNTLMVSTPIPTDQELPTANAIYQGSKQGVMTTYTQKVSVVTGCRDKTSEKMGAVTEQRNLSAALELSLPAINLSGLESYRRSVVSDFLKGDRHICDHPASYPREGILHDSRSSQGNKY